MVNDEPQNNNKQQTESVEFIPLAPLLENPDPDFDVVVVKRSKDLPGRIEYSTGESSPAPPKPENKQA